ncbi:MAG: hypothetical protein M3Z23_17785 [Acidobacteriota bacterium]|nr:hypothetical protein [Acidobacteriota bacterium]
MAAKQKVVKQPIAPVRVWAVPVLLSWVIPGGGHFFLKRRGRALMLLASVALMFFAGLAMRGAMFKPQRSDLLTTLINYGGFVSDLATGSLYFLATTMGYSQADVAGHVHDYGTKFLVTAGLLNILAMVDCYEIAAGRKS